MARDGDRLVLCDSDPACTALIGWAEPYVIRLGEANFEWEVGAQSMWIGVLLLHPRVQLSEARRGCVKG